MYNPRKKLTQEDIKKYYPNKKIQFQALEWVNDDITNTIEHPEGEFSEERNNVISIFGVTDKGHSICANIIGFNPFFYVKVDDDFKLKDKTAFITNLCKKLGTWGSKGLSLELCKLIKRKIFYGFRGDKQYKFIKLCFKNMISYHTCKKKIKECFHQYELFEEKVSPILKFIHESEIKSTSWFEIPLTYTDYDNITKCQLEYFVTPQELEKIDRIDIAPFRQMSYDIECYSSESGKFPCADNIDDVVFQIGTTFSTYGKKEEKLEHIITIHSSNPLKNKKTILVSVKTEKQALLEWAKLIEEYDPDIIYGYNNHGFDDNYLYERAKINNVVRKFCNISKFINKPADLVSKNFSSSAYGTSEWKILDIPGRINFDLLTYIRREYKLNSYKLDNVSDHFLKTTLKNCFSSQPKNNKFFIKKEFFQNFIDGCECVYSDCFKEVDLGRMTQVFQNKDCFEVSFEKEFIDKIDLQEGEFLIKLKKNPVTPTMIFESYESKDPEKIREVAEYCVQDTKLPLLIVDKLNIFLNQIQMASVTFVPFKFLIERGQQIKVYSQLLSETKKKGFLIPNIVPKKGNFEGATVLNPMVGFFDKPVLVLDFASLYPTIIRAHNLCYSSIVLSNEFLNLPNYDYYKVQYQDHEDNSTKTYYFVQNNESILPDLLKNLMDERTRVRKEMKDPNLDPFKKMVLNGFQLALKVSANSIYGFLAAQTLQCTPISACTTAIGRNMIKNTKEFVNENYKDFETIYGDSVTKDTLITIKNEFGNLKTQEIQNICNKWEDYSQFKGTQQGLYLKQQNEGYLENKFVYSKNKWTKLLRVIRHKTDKKIYKVVTKKGIVFVTEDHSLITSNGKYIKPQECKKDKTLLLHKKIDF